MSKIKKFILPIFLIFFSISFQLISIAQLPQQKNGFVVTAFYPPDVIESVMSGVKKLIDGQSIKKDIGDGRLYDVQTEHLRSKPKSLQLQNI